MIHLSLADGTPIAVNSFHGFAVEPTDRRGKTERTEGFKDISDNIGSIPLPTADGVMKLVTRRPTNSSN